MKSSTHILLRSKQDILESIWDMAHTYMYVLIDGYIDGPNGRYPTRQWYKHHPILQLWEIFQQVRHHTPPFFEDIVQDLRDFRGERDCERMFRFWIKKCLATDKGFVRSVGEICTPILPLDTSLSYRVWDILRPDLYNIVEREKGTLDAKTIWSLLRKYCVPQNIVLTECMKGVDDSYPSGRHHWMILVKGQVKKELYISPALADEVKVIVDAMPILDDY